MDYNVRMCLIICLHCNRYKVLLLQTSFDSHSCTDKLMTCKFLCVQNTFATLKVSVPVSQGPSSLPLDVYLDTRTMQMLHGPLPYFPDEDVSMNYSSKLLFDLPGMS